MFKHIKKSLRWTVCILAVAAIFMALHDARADDIYFKTGYSERGVVMRETETSIRFKTDMGMITISREKVDFIDKASAEENKTLLRKWRQEELRKEQQLADRREARKKFKADHIAKGHVKFEGEWMTPERRLEILGLRKKAAEHQEQFEQTQRKKGLVRFQHIWVTPSTRDELYEMGAEIRKLSDELENQALLVDSLRSAVAKAPSFDDAEQFTKRISEATDTMAGLSDRLNRLFERADEIEAASIRYEMPERFRKAFPTEEVPE
jgi:hypothetical protein